MSIVSTFQSMEKTDMQYDIVRTKLQHKDGHKSNQQVLKIQHQTEDNDVINKPRYFIHNMVSTLFCTVIYR